MRLALSNSLESRDGTLSKDAKMKNMVIELIEGQPTAVKRPGIIYTTEPVPGGMAQGLISLNGIPYSITDDSLINLNTLESLPLGGGGSGGGAGPIDPAKWVKVYEAMIDSTSGSHDTMQSSYRVVRFQGRVLVFFAWNFPGYPGYAYATETNLTAWTSVFNTPEMFSTRGPKLVHGSLLFGLPRVFSATSNIETVADIYATENVYVTTAVTSAPISWGVTSRTDYSVVSWGGYLWIYGGTDQSGNLLDDVWRSSNGIAWTQTCAAVGYGQDFATFYDQSGYLWLQTGGEADQAWFRSSDGVTWDDMTATLADSGDVYWGAAAGSAVINSARWQFGGSYYHYVDAFNIYPAIQGYFKFDGSLFTDYTLAPWVGVGQGVDGYNNSNYNCTIPIVISGVLYVLVVGCVPSGGNYGSSEYLYVWKYNGAL